MKTATGALVISSGLITAHAVEGKVRALFGLTVPFSETVAGPEMELLVGLAKGGLELAVGVDQALDLVQRVHDEQVDKVLAGSVEPVVEGLTILSAESPLRSRYAPDGRHRNRPERSCGSGCRLRRDES